MFQKSVVAYPREAFYLPKLSAGRSIFLIYAGILTIPTPQSRTFVPASIDKEEILLYLPGKGETMNNVK